MTLLVNYSFPGNVRELENLLENVAALSFEDPQTITDKDLKPLLNEACHLPAPDGVAVSQESFSMQRVERFAIQRALEACHGNRTKAASLLGISRDTLYRKLRQFGSPPAPKSAHTLPH